MREMICRMLGNELTPYVVIREGLRERFLLSKRIYIFFFVPVNAVSIDFSFPVRSDRFCGS